MESVKNYSGLSVPREVRDSLRALCKRKGWSIGFLAGRVIEHYVSQPSILQRMVFGDVEPEVREAYIKWLDGLRERVERDGVVESHPVRPKSPKRSPSGSPASPA